ncbi:MAG TPA: hypothetical protein VK951_10640 [Miltoncostaeaceae bacterium]|nr:hypothetical protein [Miltoncostaeaceae bacterium]
MGPDDDIDQIERLTRRVARGAVVGVPTWIVLLALLPFTGLGVVACLALATGLAIVAVVVAERLRRDGRGGQARRRDRPRRAMSPLAAAGLTLLAVAIVAYVIFVISST